MEGMQEMKTELSAIAPALAKMTEKQQAEMIGWLNGYIAGVEAKREEQEPEKAS